MAWSRFCTERPGYCHYTSSAHHAACPYCGEANPIKQEPVRETPPPEVIDLSDSPPALQSTRFAPSRFAVLDQQGNGARSKSIKQTKQTPQSQPNAGSLVHSSRQPANPSMSLSSPIPRTPPLKLELRIAVNEMIDFQLYTYDNTTWRTIR